MKKLLFACLLLLSFQAYGLYTYKQTFNYVDMVLKEKKKHYGLPDDKFDCIAESIRFCVFIEPNSHIVVDGKPYWDFNVVDNIIKYEIIRYFYHKKALFNTGNSFKWKEVLK